MCGEVDGEVVPDRALILLDITGILMYIQFAFVIKLPREGIRDIDNLSQLSISPRSQLVACRVLFELVKTLQVLQQCFGSLVLAACKLNCMSPRYKTD